jgi:hypothetical protein
MRKNTIEKKVPNHQKVVLILNIATTLVFINAILSIYFTLSLYNNGTLPKSLMVTNLLGFLFYVVEGQYFKKRIDKIQKRDSDKSTSEQNL